jgi:large subunit ribosomal protein L19
MPSLIQKVEAKYKKRQIVHVKSGDTVAVHQKIKEGNKERVQIFEGMVIKASRANSLTATIVVRRIASGVGVEKSFLLHHPNILKVVVTKRSKVRRNYLSYMRGRRGKASRLTGVEFDRHAVNTIVDVEAEKEEEKLREEALKQHEAEELAAAKAAAEEEAKHAAEFAAHQEVAEELATEEPAEKS